MGLSKPPQTLAFDVYGTLINTHGLLVKLTDLIGDEEKAALFSKTWRDKQLEYSFRRGSMRDYVSFSVCTAQALDYTCLALRISLSSNHKKELMKGYKLLPAFDETKLGLANAKAAGYRIFAFSNGDPDDLVSLFKHAGIEQYFEDIISAADIRSYKPNIDVYRHFLNKAQSKANLTWLVSSNPFDILGAQNAGWKTAWIKRSNDTIFDPWGIDPTLTLPAIDHLC